MKISPTLTEVKKIAKTGKYDILPVSCEILSDFITKTHKYSMERLRKFCEEDW